MKCHCGKNTRVISSVNSRRRRQCTSNHRFWTIEVLEGDYLNMTRQKRYQVAVKRLQAMGWLK